MLYCSKSTAEEDETEAGEEADTIGETVYSKHWLFCTLTRLIQVYAYNKQDSMVTDQESGLSGSSLELTEDLEEDLCKVWDMAMDKDVAVFFQEFKAPGILLGVIAKSRKLVLLEICIGILGNMACFHYTCVSLTQNSDLWSVLIKLLLTCVSQPDVASLWLERIQQQTTVCSGLCFIMTSSTNVDLVVKVGELVDKLFDEDEEMMKSWVSTPPSNSDPNMDTQQDILEEDMTFHLNQINVVLEVYLHSLQLLTTVEEGMQALDGTCGHAVWTFVCKIVCEDLCQADDPPLILQEQKALLGSELLGSLIRILQFNAVCHQSRTAGNSYNSCIILYYENVKYISKFLNLNIQMLNILLINLLKIPFNLQDLLSSIVKEGYLTERSCVSAVGTLVPQHVTAVHSSPLFFHYA
uniref:Serum amyloid A-like 1 n=1 Tax=Cyprinus carpio carpio TaxID=630221 RepID=A0A8C1HMZ2_CYPCA